VYLDLSYLVSDIYVFCVIISDIVYLGYYFCYSYISLII